MNQLDSLKQMASEVEELRRIAQNLYDTSDDFPAVNRNAKRILASIQMLRINLEISSFWNLRDPWADCRHVSLRIRSLSVCCVSSTTDTISYFNESPSWTPGTMKTPIYLDYNGTSPLDPEVIAAMRTFLEEEFGNPSSSHWFGIAPKKAVELSRHRVASLLNCDP